MNQNNILKNQTETKQLKKPYIKKDMYLSHKTIINPQKKLEDNHKTNIKKN